MRAAVVDEMAVPECMHSPARVHIVPIVTASLLPLVFFFACPAFSFPPDDIIDEDFDLEEIAPDADASFIGMNEAGSSFPAAQDTTSCMRNRESGMTGDVSVLEKYIHDETRPEYQHDNAHHSLRTGIRYRETTGDPFGKYWNRYIGKYGNRLKITMLAEHDPEEPGAIDYLSGSITIPARKAGGGLVAGDYRPSFGEGLVFSRTSRRYRTGTDVAQRMAYNPANTSFEESHYLRGMFVRAGRGR
jgi:hypothetical protein